MGYWIWYLVIALAAWAFKLPWIAAIAVLFVLGRKRLPDPVEWTRNVRTVRELRARIEASPGDLIARRNLARLYLGKHRAREAVALLEEAIAKGLSDPEAFYLLGLGRWRAGEVQSALEPLVKSVGESERLLLGEPYFIAARALYSLGRFDEAEDAIERGLAVNSSRVDAHVQLGRVRAARGDRAGARAAYESALQTFRALPEYLKWQNLGAYAAAQWRRLRA